MFTNFLKNDHDIKQMKFIIKATLNDLLLWKITSSKKCKKQKYKLYILPHILISYLRVNFR